MLICNYIRLNILHTCIYIHVSIWKYCALLIRRNLTKGRPREKKKPPKSDYLGLTKLQMNSSKYAISEFPLNILTSIIIKGNCPTTLEKSGASHKRFGFKSFQIRYSSSKRNGDFLNMSLILLYEVVHCTTSG